MEYVKSLYYDNPYVPLHVMRLLLFIAAALVIHQIVSRICVPLLGRIGGQFKSHVDFSRLFRRLFLFLPAAIVSSGLYVILDGHPEMASAVSKVINLYCVAVGLAVYEAALSLALDIYNLQERAKRVSLTGIFQALKLVGVLLAVVAAIALLAGKSPIYFLSGLGAFTAILLLIFKDAILGLVAGIQLSAMDLVRKGDWIDIPKHGADGNVEEISLTTVMVRNWDKTVTAVPAYELVSSSFKNWRGMIDTGGRRIKRSIRINLDSVHFLSEHEYKHLCRIKLLKPYLEEKLAELESANAENLLDADRLMPVNGRRLTNIGTFRAYCDAYLRQHAGIKQDLMILVRQLQATELGLPIEIYAFTNDVRWPFYEKIQSDIFDHVLSILPEFGLRTYQR
jgi:miniconductance mechanosensitive channel